MILELIIAQYFWSSGKKAMAKKNYKKAIKYFNKGMYINPAFLGFAFNLGEIYFTLKDYERSIEFFNKIIEKEDSEFAYNRIFVSFYMLGKYYSARKFLEKCELIFPDGNWVKLGKLWMLNRFTGYSLKFVCSDRNKVCAFSVGGFNAKYKFKEDTHEDRMDYFRKFKKWNRRIKE